MNTYQIEMAAYNTHPMAAEYEIGRTTYALESLDEQEAKRAAKSFWRAKVQKQTGLRTSIIVDVLSSTLANAS